MFTTADLVRAWLRLDAGQDADLIDAATAAANAVVARYAPAPGTDEEAAGDVALAATMIAARLYRRRNSAEGVSQITETGAVYIARNDPDVSRLLRIDGFSTPQVG